MAPKPAPAAEPDDRAEYLAAVDEGLADVKAGRIAPYEKVRRWLLSWGSDKELPPPKCP
jgi:predicted transcriptional regulator